MSTKILILEDEKTIRENLAEYLDDDGFITLQAPSAEEALELLKSEPHLAIVDIRLPGMDGNEWMLLAREQMPNLHFLVYTGYMEYKLSKQLKDIGLTENDVLFKPIPNMADISQAILKKLKAPS